MSDQNVSVNVVNDGTFSLDPGAVFGLSPKNIWSKFAEPNDLYRIKLNTNLTVIGEGAKFYLLDGGIGNSVSEYYAKWFEAKPTGDLERLKRNKEIENFECIFHTHLHFDHSGHSFSDLSGTRSIASMEEIKNLRNPNELARSSYFRLESVSMERLEPIFNDTKFGNFNMSITGGHTTGHTIIIYKNDKIKLIYGGDLFPSTFHLKPSRITGIDQEPLKSLETKKVLLKKAIKESYGLILSHDTVETIIIPKGEVDDPKYDRWEMP